MLKHFFALATLLLLFASCGKDDPVHQTPDLSAELRSAGEDVILKTYQNLDQASGVLVAAVTELEANPGEAQLEVARQAWRDARRPWEQAEGFLFGPVDQLAIDPAIDDWPVSVTDLNNVLQNGPATLDKATVDGFETTLKGFHTIEYLLFGESGNKAIGSFSARELQYLRAAAESLKGETARLYSAWAPSGGNFLKNMLQAGTSASIYPSQKAALQDLANGLVTIADEVANGKIHDPYSQHNVSLEESRFSANSKADFADNIRSIRNIYLGYINTASGQASLHTLVATDNTALDAKISGDIDAAIAAIENIPGTFTTAIFDHGTEVENARDKVRDLLDTLQGDLIPFVQAL